MNVGLRDLEAVLAVVRTGTFSAAAKELSVSQPAVSSRVRHAEDTLGVKLFHRTTKRVTPTEHGLRLADRAEQAIAELRVLAQEFKEESRLERGTVSLGATPAITGALLPAAIQRFRQRWPAIQVDFHDEFLALGLQAVDKGDFDLFVAPQVLGDARFECETLMDEEFVLVAQRHHRLVRTGLVTLEEVLQNPLVTMPVGTRTRELLAAACKEAGLPFKPAYETKQIVSLMALVRAGAGVAFMSENLLPLFNMENLKTARLQDVALRRRITIVRAKGRAVQPAARMLIDAIRQVLGEGA